MITGKASREYVPPKYNRGEFGHHARQQASISHSPRILLRDCKELGSQLRAWARTALPPTPLLIPLFRNEVSGTISLGVPHPFTVCAYGPHTRLVRVVARPPHRAAVKTYVPTLRCVRSRHLCCLLCVMLILPLPQLVRCSRTPCRRAKVLLTRPRPHIPTRGLL